MAVTRLKDRPEGFNRYLNHEGKTVVVNKMLAHYLLCHKEVAETSGQDVVGLVVGGEGAGKSKLVRQMGKLVDPKLTEQRIEFDPESFIQQHYKGLPETWEHEIYVKGGYEGKPYECIIMDESIEANRRRAMSEMNVKLISFLTQSRQLHKIVFIVLPSPFLLEKYIGEFRAKFIINVKFDRKKNERIFQYYNQKGLRKIFNATANFRNSAIFDIVRPIHTGNFPKTEPFDIRRYEAKKAAAINKYRRVGQTESGNPEELRQTWELRACKKCYEGGYDAPSVYHSLGIAKSTWSRWTKQLKEEAGDTKKNKGAGSRATMDDDKALKEAFKELRSSSEFQDSNT